ncbi:methyl-accepting chemotaxis protein [Desulfurispira natronophila]|uniref:Methyl-accepting chemotaxis protein-2 (Aspartate sensor receptor) n=1 Tax=Desulfurispira natronophila TaxID=682562 RepID=A0A7W7Y3E6_9BACT|nr:methyl-accepting chemotaxis protein [Desulfurispira natronophila]MBB5021337.1 methyl-accepting chemotaxis protein-2 (aspartate sensor receptor) [Desulfurispira natronophila]
MIQNISIGVRASLVIAVSLAVVLALAIFLVDRNMRSSAIQQAEVSITDTNDVILNMIASLHGEIHRATEQLHNLLEITHRDEDMVIESEERIDGAPVLRRNDQVLNHYYSEMDDFTKATGAVATIFVRDGDDFVRITTSLTDRDGERAVGTRLDRNHPAYQRLLDRREFTGRAELFGRAYYTRYTPIIQDGRVIGSLFIGNLIAEALDGIEQIILDTSVGETGYPFVFGRDSMVMEIHPSIAGESIADSTDAEGRTIFRTMAQERSGTLYYLWSDPGGGTGEKVMAYDYYEPWDLIIATSTYMDELTADAQEMRTYLITGAFIMAAVMAGLIVWLLQVLVARPLAQVVGAAKRIADGDFQQKLNWQRQDEIGELANAFNRMASSLSAAMFNVNHAVESVASGSQELAATAEQMMQAANEQDQSTSELAAAVSEMHSTVEQIAQNIEMTAERGQEANDSAQEGYAAVAQAIEVVGTITQKVEASSKSVEELGEAVGDINQIADVISDITDQTNLLALNAAIEAARAGEHGRGFAVVADEVRKLAERTQDSTREISDRIHNLQSQAHESVSVIKESVCLVETGNRTASQAGEKLNDITRQTSEMADMVGQVAAAAQQQAATNNQIAQSVERVKGIAEQNSHAASGIAEAANGLSRVSDELQQLVGQFRLREEGSSSSGNDKLPQLVK